MNVNDAVYTFVNISGLAMSDMQYMIISMSSIYAFEHERHPRAILLSVVDQYQLKNH